jgi:oxygen-independent coproporphyrinogen-3 oxidase
MNERLNLETLIENQAIPPYVYTYPPRSAYRSPDRRWDIRGIWNDDLSVSLNRDLNLYLHVPFCRYKCGFCNLYTVISTERDVYDAYVDALVKQLFMHREIIEARNLRTIYLGGGTPSLLTSDHFARIFEAIEQIYPNWRTTVDEVCCEATPDSIVDSNGQNVRDLVSLGGTRINMGVQSLQRAELKEAGRLRANEDVIREAFQLIRAAHVSNLSTDLIMGFNGQTKESWELSVMELLELRPETISTYFLTVRPDAWFAKTGKYQYYRDPSLYERYDFARSAYLSSGYAAETNIRYKIPGRGGYLQKVLQFRGTPYLGIGAGARSYTNTVDYLIGGSHNPKLDQVWEYIHAIDDGRLDITAAFVYTDEERIRKRLALDLFNLDLSDFERYGGSSMDWIYQDILQAAADLDLVKKVGATRYQLTSRGFKYRDILSWTFFSPQVRELDREFYRNIHNQLHRGVELGMPSDAVPAIAV